MNIAKQIKELKVYFDSDLITNKSSVEKLTPNEYTSIRLKIKENKEDGVKYISGRVYIQFFESEVFIFDCN